VVISLVRNNEIDASRPRSGIGFLGEKERATVMFSRAEKLLIVLGSSAHFRRFPSANWIVEVFERATVLDSRDFLPPTELERIAKIKSKH
jgi:hypothetical protein